MECEGLNTQLTFEKLDGENAHANSALLHSFHECHGKHGIFCVQHWRIEDLHSDIRHVSLSISSVNPPHSPCRSTWSLICKNMARFSS